MFRNPRHGCHGPLKDRKLHGSYLPETQSGSSKGRFAYVPASEPSVSGAASAKKRKAWDSPLSPYPHATSAGFSPSPLFINDITNVVDIARRLRLGVHLSVGIVFSLSRRNILHVSCATETEHAAVVERVRKNGLQFYTLSNEKAAHAIRSLDMFSDPAELVDELCELGFRIKETIRLYGLRSYTLQYPF